VPIAPSTYYDAIRRPPSARTAREEQLQARIARVHADKYGVYGARKVWLPLNREGVAVAGCTVKRLMGGLGLSGAERHAVPHHEGGCVGGPGRRPGAPRSAPSGSLVIDV